MVRTRIGASPANPPPAAGDARESSGWAALLAPVRWATELLTFASVRDGAAVAWIAIALGGCGDASRVEVEGTVRDGRTGAPVAHATVSTEDGRSTETDDDGRFSIEVEEGDATLTADAPGRCPTTERVRVRRGMAPITLHLHDALEVDALLAQVGFDQAVEIEARARCATGPITWTQVGGPDLEGRMRAEDGTLSLRTHPLEELVRLDDRVGVIALDRAQRGDYRFEARARVGDHEEHRSVRVVAAPVSAGLFQVPTGADVYLNGGRGDEHAWTILARPDDSEAELDGASTRVSRLRPDALGTYLLEHQPTRTQVQLHAGAYDDVPRDCGQDGCHESEDRDWQDTVHARTFRRGLDGALGDAFDERCWSCHATGADPGVDNGGVHQTAARLGWHQPSPDGGAWDEAPGPIQHDGAVWCSACHGTGRVVAPEFRWQYGAKLQAGVCARCHDVDAGDPDADHVSPHVDEWRLSAMSGFVRDLGEDDPALREGCATCHSAQGFIESRRRGATVTPERATVSPITCGACHDVHDAERPRGLRVYDTSDPIAGERALHLGSGALCASCHRSGVAREGDLDAAPHAPQADLLVGRGARTVAPSNDGSHRHIADTCVRCHMTRPDEGDPLLGLAGGHTFAARALRGSPELSSAACAPCHGDDEAPEAIGVRDWDGDGRPGRVVDEHDAALARLTARFRARVIEARLRGRCGREAVDVVERDARLHLVDAQGVMLGDCDGDGAFTREAPVTVEALSPTLRDVAWDLSLLRSDGSRGLHNPPYAFAVLRAASARLSIQ